MLEFNVNFDTSENLSTSISALARKLAFETVLQVNSGYYQITDFEFYLNSKTAGMEDPHTYNHDLQKKNGRIYDHASGLDFTFGDGNNALGILIRGIAKLKDDHITGYTDGPYKARTEIMSNLEFSEHNIFVLKEISQKQSTYRKQNYKLVTTSRVNLAAKKADEDGHYMKEALRYVCLIPRFERITNEKGESKWTSKDFQLKINGTEKIVKQALDNGCIDQEFARRVIGYWPKLWKLDDSQ